MVDRYEIQLAQLIARNADLPAQTWDCVSEQHRTAILGDTLLAAVMLIVIHVC
jgi:hypothetical protein